MKKIISIFLCIVMMVVATASLLSCNINDQKDYEAALLHIEKGEYAEAKVLFEKLGDYKDSAEHLSKFYYMPTAFEYDLIDKKGTNPIEYNSQNLPSKEIVEREDVSAVYDFIYDEKGNILSQILTMDGNVTRYDYTYDTNGRRIAADYSAHDGVTVNYIFDYDEAGNMSYVYYGESTGLVYEYYFTYDEMGKTSREEVVSGDDRYIYDINREYDANGNEIRSYCAYDGMEEISEYTYDDKGNCTKYTYSQSDGTGFTYEYFYDENSNMIRETYIDNENILEYVEIEYKLLYIPTGITGGTEYFFIDFWGDRL